MVRTGSQIVLLTLSFFILFAGLAAAGSIDDPEVVDPDEADNGGGDLDIISAWYDGDSDTHFNSTLRLYSFPPIFTELDTVEYEVYFSIDGDDFAAVAIFDTGDGITPPDFGLRAVTYDANGSVASEEDVVSIEGDYNTTAATVTCQIPKDPIPASNGAPVYNTWAAVWVTPSLGGTRQIDDEAMNYTAPGSNYSLSGLVISETEFNEVSAPGGTVVFETLLSNPGTQNLSLDCNHSYDHNWQEIHPEKWDVTLTVDGQEREGTFPLTLVSGDSATIRITIVIPEDPTSTPLIGGFPAISASLELTYWLYDPGNNVTGAITYQVLVNTTADGEDEDDDDDDDDEWWLPGFEVPAVFIAVVVSVAVMGASATRKHGR